MSTARLTVSVGGGGVGKTTTSAALAVAMAREHRRTLVITVDPARRLADVLGADVGQQAHPVSIDQDSNGWLFARMPDSNASLDDFVTWLFEEPWRRARVIANPAYRELSNSLAGVHELVTICLLQQEVDSGRYDEIVLDTAPSRHALAFLTYPARLLGLLEARALAWLAALAHASRGAAAEPLPRAGLLEWGRSKVEALIGKLVGVEGLKNLSSLFADMLAVRQRWTTLVRRTNEMLRDKRTRYFIIGAPTGSATDDVAYLVSNLTHHRLAPSAIVLNRAEPHAPASERALREAIEQGVDGLSPLLRGALDETLRKLASEHETRKEAVRIVCEKLAVVAPAGVPVIRLPLIRRADSRAIVLALANACGSAGLAGGELLGQGAHDAAAEPGWAERAD